MNKKWLCLILMLAMGTRGTLILRAFQHEFVKNPWDGGAHLHAPDSWDYERLADEMLRHGSFGTYYSGGGETPEIFRTPGYPVLLSAIRGGVNALSNHPFAHTSGDDYIVVAIQVLFDMVLVYLTCRLGAMLVSTRVGLLAGLLQTLSPLAVGSSCRILSDSLYAFGFTAAVVLAVGFLRSGKGWLLIGAAAALGISCYVRPVALLLTPVFALVMLYRHTSSSSVNSFVGRIWLRIRPSLAFLAVFVAFIAPWVIRNGVEAEYWGFSSVFGDTLAGFAVRDVVLQVDANGSHSLARLQEFYRTGRWGIWEGAYEAMPPDEYARQLGNSLGEQARLRERRALEIIFAHPWIYAKLHAKGCMAFWLPGTDVLEIAGLTTGNRGTLEVLHKDGLWAATKLYFGDSGWAIALAVPIALFTLVQYLAGLLCVGRGLRGAFRAKLGTAPIPAGQGQSPVLLLALIAVVSCLVSGTTGTPRFRVPVEPILNIAAAAGIMGLLARWRKPHAGQTPVQP